MKKIIHLSDLHVGYENCLDNLRIIVDTLIRLKKPNNNYVVVITGDIVETGDNGLFSIANKELHRLRDAEFEVLVVPGNHDYGYHGIKGNTKWVSIFKKVFFKNPNITYPKLDIIEEVAFIGLDSMEEELNWFDCFGSQGELGVPQLDRLQELLAKDEVIVCQKRVVYLHHHPFNPEFDKELKDAKALGEVLQNKNIDALLFGHNHNGRNFNGYWGIARCLEGGSATSKDNDTTAIRVIDLDEDPRSDYMMDIITNKGEK